MRRDGERAVGPPTLQRVGALVELPRLLREHGVAPEAVLAAAGVEPRALGDCDNFITLSSAFALIAKSVEATRRADFAMTAGAAARLRHLGAVGELLEAAPDFGAALTDFVSNHPRYVKGASAYLIDRGDDGVLIGHRIYEPGLGGFAPFSLAAMTFGRAIFSELCGVLPCAALLSSPQPEDVTLYRKAFPQGRLVFGCEHFGLLYSRAALARPIPTADPIRHKALRSHVARRWRKVQPDIRDRLLRVLVPSVLAGAQSLQSAAAAMGVHPRTLNRALAARGITFRDTLKEAQLEIACQLLRDTRMSVGDLGGALGYSEVSAFTRFFSAQAGVSPTEWRRGQTASPTPV